jgi:pyruvate formate lyase activating enzyme
MVQETQTPLSREDPEQPERGLTRREAIQRGLAGAAMVGVVGAVAWRMMQAARDMGVSGVFKGDAPAGELWALWQKRGWAKEGYHYVKIGRNVQCLICPNNCLLEPEDRGHCRNRVNKDGTLYTLAYANPCALHVDPIEKKPLFHFLPGTKSFSLATAGCVLRCLNCQNWDISQRTPEQTKDPRGPELRLRPPVPELTPADMTRLSAFPEDLVALAQATGCRSLSYTYSEPIAFYEYTYDTCKLARSAGLKNVVVTSGSIEERPLRDLVQHVDALHVDLKGFDESIYRALNSARLTTILNTIKTLKDMGIWYEVINLVVPTYTDNLDVIARMCDWLVKEAGPDVPLHFSRFHPQHQLQQLPPTPVEILVRARAIARQAGLRYVYIGNAPGLVEAETTYCPNCRQAVIDRNIYAVTGMNLVAGKCATCQTKIAGVWS